VSKPGLSDSRRLTGANLFWDHPSAILDATLSGDASALISSWTAAANKLLIAVGISGEKLCSRSFQGGCSLLISAPVDVLYSMCELNEAAFGLALADLGFDSAPDFDETVSSLRKLFNEEANPAMLALQSAARQHDVPFLWDDDYVSVGYGKSALVWTPDQLPDPGQIDWATIKSIPVALVTGTNGKSTTVRMSAAIIAASGKRAGLTSTDWIRIGERILDSGDYSGTGGARTLMRHPETEVAVLETARGGLLRRGLGVEKTAAALITNVASDHLGEYGIDTVDDLVEAKFIVRRALDDNAPLILNADDEGIVTFAHSLDCKIIWFSLDPDNPLLRTHLANGGSAAILRNGMLELNEGQSVRTIIAATDIPATVGGAARHNIQNALAATALCNVLGASDDAIREGLAGFRGDEADNPGRGNWFENHGVKVLVDFAHNTHGTQALAQMVSAVPAKRRVLLTGQAGDRNDRDIYDMVVAACEMDVDIVLSCALPGYERGRPPCDVQDIIRSAALDSGVTSENVIYFDSPLEAAEYALADSRDGDLLVFLALTQREEVIERVHQFMKPAANTRDPV
jgi:cyanophycin synthetase